MDIENSRVSKLRDYLFKEVISKLRDDDKYQINADMLSQDINNYSIDRVPVASTIETWIIGIEKHRDLYIFRSRMAYSQDVMNNMENIGFFEKFESIINENNKKGVLPEIDGIESIECLNSGSMNDATTNTCEFNIQIQISYTTGGEL